MGSSLKVCQNFQEALSPLRSVGVAYWVRAVTSVLGVCLLGSTLRVRYGKESRANFCNIIALTSLC